MSSTPVDEDPSRRTERAVNAAVLAGRSRGLKVTDPVVLHDVFSVVVHLVPAPVVARVPVVPPPALRDDVEAQLDRQRVELDVVHRLLARELPVVRPYVNEPILQSGFCLTLWHYVDHRRVAQPDYKRNCQLTADLHAEMAALPTRLPFLGPIHSTVPQALDELTARPDLIDVLDLERARREWELLAPVLTDQSEFERRFPGIPVQVIHGDSPPYNIITDARRELHSDFEDACVGPIEWDLTMLNPECVAAYDAAARGRGLRPVNPDVLRLMESARLLQVVACLALVPQLPKLAKGLSPVVQQWRSRPLPATP
ncbi:aminoglycoside phosphotransferase family protein [Pseudonocardiaceae bacterium YIM PH 21723]|nr:aminoglycoside phosphotransferase family protein [Pseudonocardiaceae bacterium YIM PH 21723]